tara:strand:- start:41 stop:451 length:411 start_codon:yes stop_codon:yes gene_type:complete
VTRATCTLRQLHSRSLAAEVPSLRKYLKNASVPKLGSIGILEPSTIREYLSDASGRSEMGPIPSYSKSSNTIRHHCKSIVHHDNMAAIQCLFLLLSAARPNRAYCHKSSRHMVKESGEKSYLQVEVLMVGVLMLEY